MVFSFDFSFQMQFHQNQCISANVSPLAKWHLLTEERFVAQLLPGSCRGRATLCGWKRGARGPAGAQPPAPGRTPPTQPLRPAIGRRERSTRALPVPHAAARWRPISGKAQPRPEPGAGSGPVARQPVPPRHGENSHLSPRWGCDEGGNVPPSHQVIHCPGPVLSARARALGGSRACLPIFTKLAALSERKGYHLVSPCLLHTLPV